jgi:hypothetical protein
LYLDNDLDILIGKNPFDALTELASGRQKIRLWADQICINQRDDTEKKEQQVNLLIVYPGTPPVLETSIIDPRIADFRGQLDAT